MINSALHFLYLVQYLVYYQLTPHLPNMPIVLGASLFVNMVLPLNLNFLMAVCNSFMAISPCLTSNSLLSQSHLNQTKKSFFLLWTLPHRNC